MITQLNYFGTDLRQAGHYYFNVGQGMTSNRDIEKTIKFYPEGLVEKMNNGDMNLVTINGLNIIAICGSPYDKRPGSKSIFWSKKGDTFQELKEAILTLPASKNIIKNMSERFEIKWSF